MIFIYAKFQRHNQKTAGTNISVKLKDIGSMYRNKLPSYTLMMKYLKKKIIPFTASESIYLGINFNKEVKDPYDEHCKT